MTRDDHLSNDLLVRAVDDELSPLEALLVDSHLPVCEVCRKAQRQLYSLSLRVEAVAAASVNNEYGEDREALVSALDARESRLSPRPSPPWLRQFGWGVGIAAALTLGILVSPQWIHRGTGGHASGQVPASSASFEIDGETFVALPYSNPDLPLAAPHIVQMEVPVSSLAQAGIVFEPVSNEVAMSDRSVLADVLLGMDGQPLGVHVISAE